jgi:uncharacterized protein (TIGR03435 family)
VERNRLYMQLKKKCGRVAVIAAVTLCTWGAARAQSAGAPDGIMQPTMMAKDADPGWDVVTVRPSDPNTSQATFDVRGRHIIIGNRTVETMLLLAYGLQKNQIVGGPDWVRTERFDADGIPTVEGQPSLEQFRSMLRKLLAERFGLVTHMEQRELSAYAITIAKGGPKLTQSKADPNALQSDSDKQDGGQRSIQMSNATMAGFALELLFNIDRPVVDRTSLTGRYDFTLKWTSDDSNVPTDGSAAPSLFTAIQEQMGLKLEGVKAMTDVMLIDKVKRPGAN